VWDPAVYLEHANDRARPFLDLMGRVGARDPAVVVDLGCGPGGLTGLLADRWPSADVVGVDSSEEMVQRAQSGRHSGRCSFVLGDVRDWQPTRPVDVLVSNATLQWVPDHLALLPRWVEFLGPGGWLAIQVPSNFDAPSHTLMRELAGSPRWRDRLGGVLRHADAVAEPGAYLEVLAAAGAAVDVWQTTYVHVLTGDDPVLSWVRGTGLRPVLSALLPEDGVTFEVEYAELLRTAYPAQPYGTPFPFTRTFAVAHRTGGAAHAEAAR
jgi:trans-aconitate 2-methyltransferase